MPTVAYLAIQFPSAVEPYVTEEIEELRSRGVQVIPGSVRKAPSSDGIHLEAGLEMVVLQPLRIIIAMRALWLCILHWNQIADLMRRVVLGGRESPIQRIKALVHTWLGACYALGLDGLGVEHIHAHHGYFGSWIAMTAARFLDVSFSMTLHGSDLLLHGAYLDTKLENCRFCLTVSEYNRRYIFEQYPAVEAKKVLVSRLGVCIPECKGVPGFARGIGSREPSPDPNSDPNSELSVLAVGRLHAVKDHAFLVRACAQLRACGLRFECLIGGEGPERSNLESLIREHGLRDRVRLLGHVPNERMDSLYERADVVVLTSRSEGIPLVLMEAMARGKLVLAPEITGIPELVIAGKTGFLYKPGSLADFVARLLFILSLVHAHQRSDQSPDILSAAKQFDWIRHGARVQVRHNFNRTKNLESFGHLFIQRTVPQSRRFRDEDLVLQQI
jgi:glycosyltransferase involved in cell wall biosynthesis